MLIRFNKPYQIHCQFSGGTGTLADFIRIPGVYPAGRLDKDSEGLVLLTDDGELQAKITNPRFKLPKRYLVQVEGIPEKNELWKLRRGVIIGNRKTLPARVDLISPPALWDRMPPIRQRKNIPTQWLEITLMEGRNRQIRRMTAAVNHPTLRLVRTDIGPWSLGNLLPGQWQQSSQLI